MFLKKGHCLVVLKVQLCRIVKYLFENHHLPVNIYCIKNMWYFRICIFQYVWNWNVCKTAFICVCVYLSIYYLFVNKISAILRKRFWPILINLYHDNWTVWTLLRNAILLWTSIRTLEVQYSYKHNSVATDFYASTNL